MDTLDQLNETFADNFVNNYRVHSIHFNIVGEEFYSYHKLLQKIYEDGEAIQDDLGELIRALDALAPETITEILALADLEDTTTLPGTMDLIRFVLDGQEHMINSYYKLNEVAEDEGHVDIANFAQDRIRKHKKYAWQLKSILG